MIPRWLFAAIIIPMLVGFAIGYYERGKENNMKPTHWNDITYIGDGVYAYFDGYQIYIYTSDGIEESDVIALEDNTMIALIDYARNHFSKGIIK